MRGILFRSPGLTPHPGPLQGGRESAAPTKTYPHPLHPVGHWPRFSGREARAQSLVPGSVRSLSAYGGDIPILRQGVRHGRGALNDRPHLPVALESGARASGKSPRAGCLSKLPLSIQRFIGSGRHPAPSSAQTARRQASWRSRCVGSGLGQARRVTAAKSVRFRPGRAEATLVPLPPSSSNRAASWSVMAPPSCSTSLMVTARRYQRVTS